MTSRQTWLRLFLAANVLGVLILPAPVSAQSDTRIAGTVRDSSGSSVANAQVSVKNDKTAEARQTTTNRQGYFMVGNLKPSSYTIKVEIAGFAPLEWPANPGVANTVQPGEAFTSAAAGTFGRLTSTVGRTVGLGTNRQMQFAFRVNF